MDTRDWLKCFEANAAEVLRPAAEAYTPMAVERTRIASSIQGFQIGEASEGRHLRAGAEEFARRTGNTDYPRAIACLIREENRHSAYLGAFMRHHGLPFAQAKWTDDVFRALRRGAGIELSLRVLVTAELVAVTYYDCLARPLTDLRRSLPGLPAETAAGVAARSAREPIGTVNVMCEMSSGFTHFAAEITCTLYKPLQFERLARAASAGI